MTVNEAIEQIKHNDCEEYCKDAKGSCSECRWGVAIAALEKLARYEEFEEHVGKEFYTIYLDCSEDYKPEYCKDHEGSCEKCPHRHPEIIHHDKLYWGDFPSIGKRAFYTEADAIEAAKKLEVE